jgi:hypothetical protein
MLSYLPTPLLENISRAEKYEPMAVLSSYLHVVHVASLKSFANDVA